MIGDVKVTELLSQMLELYEFDLYVESDSRESNKKFALLDLQGANLGNIEDDHFNNIAEVVDRLDIYHEEHIFNAFDAYNSGYLSVHPSAFQTGVKELIENPDKYGLFDITPSEWLEEFPETTRAYEMLDGEIGTGGNLYAVAVQRITDTRLYVNANSEDQALAYVHDLMSDERLESRVWDNEWSKTKNRTFSSEVSVKKVDRADYWEKVSGNLSEAPENKKYENNYTVFEQPPQVDGDPSTWAIYNNKKEEYLGIDWMLEYNTEREAREYCDGLNAGLYTPEEVARETKRTEVKKPEYIGQYTSENGERVGGYKVVDWQGALLPGGSDEHIIIKLGHNPDAVLPWATWRARADDPFNNNTGHYWYDEKTAREDFNRRVCSERAGLSYDHNNLIANMKGYENGECVERDLDEDDHER